MKLLCDQMCGSLAKWLRFFGFDTFYANAEMSDDEIMVIAQKENRILITRDKELVQRCKKNNISVEKINSPDLEKQLEQLIPNLSVDENKILTRCTICNNILQKVDKNLVEHKVPPLVFSEQNTFWFCSSCDKYYWMGSHYKNILETVKQYKEKN